MASLKKFSWKQIRDQILKIHPEFCAIIDEISPPDNYALYLGEYPYGSLLLDKGVFQVANQDNALVPLNHSSIANSVKEDLGYTRTMPMAMIIKNSIETFLQDEQRSVPASFYRSGDMVSLWRVLEGEHSYQEGSLWNISAGARTICMLPKITDKSYYNALKKKYGLKVPVPQSLNEHWSVLEKIANHENFPGNWNCQMLYFSKDWLKHKNDKKWSRFFQFILEKAWGDCIFKRNQFIFEFAFCLAQKNKKLKPNPYLADTVKYLIGMGTGEMPGFVTAIDDVAAPVAALEKVFIEDCGIKKHFPILMHLDHFSLHGKRPVYYSLEIPTTPYFSPRSSAVLSKMVDLRELKHILEAFFSETLKGDLMIEKTPLFNLAKNVSYNFYHSDYDQYHEISEAADLVKVDPAFDKILAKSTELGFPEHAPFFKGCVCIKSL